MGRRNGQRKNIAMLDSDDDENSCVSSSATIISDRMSMLETEEVQLDKKCVLEQALDDLYEKRGSTREKALANIIDAFNRNMEHEFVEKRFATLLHQCLNCIKKGSSEEIALASHAIGLLALTVGSGDKACEILQKSVTPILQALNSGSESKKTVSLLECLAVVTFVGGNEPADTERSLQIMWKLVHPKLGSKVVAVEPSAPVIAAVLSAWSFLLTTVDGWTLDPKNWQESISYLSGLLDKYERLTRIAAGEALAIIFEMGCLEKISAKAKGYTDSTVQEGEELKAKILNQIRNLSAEAGGKGSTKKDLNSQHKLFKNILEFVESGNCPETSMKIGGDSLQTTTWSQLIQLNFLKHFLGSGFLKHMQDNDLLHSIFDFMPKKKSVKVVERKMSSTEKRMYKSPNSALNKARTRFLNKERMSSNARKAGYFAANIRDD